MHTCTRTHTHTHMHTHTRAHTPVFLPPVFSISVDDLAKNNGVDRPYFMSKSLRKLMGVSNKVKPGTEIHLEEVESSK